MAECRMVVLTRIYLYRSHCAHVSPGHRARGSPDAVTATYQLEPSPVAVGQSAINSMTSMGWGREETAGLGWSQGPPAEERLTDCTGFLPLPEDDHIVTDGRQQGEATFCKGLDASRLWSMDFGTGYDESCVTRPDQPSAARRSTALTSLAASSPQAYQGQFLGPGQRLSTLSQCPVGGETPPNGGVEVVSGHWLLALAFHYVRCSCLAYHWLKQRFVSSIHPDELAARLLFVVQTFINASITCSTSIFSL